MTDLYKGIGICFGFIGVGICIFLISISSRGCMPENVLKPAIGSNGYIIQIRGEIK